MPVLLAPDFAERRRIQLDYETNGRELYNWVKGDYSNRTSQSQNTIPLGDGFGELSGAEVFMARQLEGALEAGQDRPVIWLDIGGGMGLTAQRLALHFRESIAQSRLALAVTNLAPSLDTYAYPYPASAQKLEAMKEANNDGVHYLSTVFSRLFLQTLTLPNGLTTALNGNVGFIHERCSLTAWSQIPEVHIRQIGHLLTREPGVYMVPHHDIAQPQTTDKLPYFDSRVKAIQLAHLALQDEFGIVRSGGYKGDQPGTVDYALFQFAPIGLDLLP